MANVRVVEDELTKLHKGQFDQNKLNPDFDLISNNPFWQIGKTGEVFNIITAKLGKLITKWVKEATEVSLNSGKKVNNQFNL
jgi:hypothetical protein